MAWEYVQTVGDLVMSYYDGEEDREVNLVNSKSAALFDDQKSYLLAAPWSPSGCPAHYANSSQAADYAELAAVGDAGAGTIDLQEMANVLPDGRAMYLWRRMLGKNYRIVFTINKSTLTYTVILIAAGKTVYTTTLSCWWTDVDTPRLSPVFLMDPVAGRATVVFAAYRQARTYLTQRRLEVRYIWSGASPANEDALSSCIFPLLVNNEPGPEPEPSTDPYAQGGTSTPGGGGGGYDSVSDAISLPTVPALNLTISKMLNAYLIDVQDLNDLADWIWGNYDKFDSNKVLSKIFADPTDAILALFMLPFTPGSSSDVPVTVGGYLAGSLTFAPLSEQFHDVDCGSVSIDEYWGNYLDYNPYTRITLFLPGVGEVQLDPDEVMGKTVSVLYRVDCLTGQFVAFVHGDSKVFAQYQGNCALQVPVSSADYARINAAMLQAASFAVGSAVGIATGGAAVAGEAGTMALNLDAAGAASTALHVLGSKVNHSHSGALGGASFFLGSQKPYLLIHRARQSVPDYANHYYGYPSNVTAVLGSLSGFTSVKDVILDGIPLTKPELDRLKELLASGIYI